MRSALVKISALFFLVLAHLINFLARIALTAVLLISLLIAALLTSVVYDEVTCESVTSDEKAIEIAKAWILRNGIWQIRTASGEWRADSDRGDVALFDKSVRGEFRDCSSAPQQFHYASEVLPDRDGRRWVNWVSCKNNFVASAIVTACGRVYRYRVDPRFERER